MSVERPGVQRPGVLEALSPETIGLVQGRLKEGWPGPEPLVSRDVPPDGHMLKCLPIYVQQKAPPFLKRATPAAYGGSQARDPNCAAAAGLHHSRAGSKRICDLRHSLWQHWILNLLSKPASSWILCQGLNRLSHSEPQDPVLNSDRQYGVFAFLFNV